MLSFLTMDLVINTIFATKHVLMCMFGKNLFHKVSQLASLGTNLADSPKTQAKSNHYKWRRYNLIC